MLAAMLAGPCPTPPATPARGLLTRCVSCCHLAAVLSVGDHFEQCACTSRCAQIEGVLSSSRMISYAGGVCIICSGIRVRRPRMWAVMWPRRPRMLPPTCPTCPTPSRATLTPQSWPEMPRTRCVPQRSTFAHFAPLLRACMHACIGIPDSVCTLTAGYES